MRKLLPFILVTIFILGGTIILIALHSKNTGTGVVDRPITIWPVSGFPIKCASIDADKMIAYDCQGRHHYNEWHMGAADDWSK